MPQDNSLFQLPRDPYKDACSILSGVLLNLKSPEHLCDWACSQIKARFGEMDRESRFGFLEVLRRSPSCQVKNDRGDRCRKLLSEIEDTESV
ncbi:MAG TPA: hypothetical protein P5274_02585 [Candidatus Paceibacterota bacterium]|nr:hypothetical protein [Candidatus Paceibacterota bacterium]